jgi:hypothetical protein
LLTAAENSFRQAVSEGDLGEKKEGVVWKLLGDLLGDWLGFLRRLPDHQQAGKSKKDRHHRSLITEHAHDGKFKPYDGQHERADPENQERHSPTSHGERLRLRTADDPFVAAGEQPARNNSKASLPRG